MLDSFSHVWLLIRLFLALVLLTHVTLWIYSWAQAASATIPVPEPDCADVDWTQRRACKDSLGFLLSSDRTWEIRREAHEVHARERSKVWSNMIDQVVTSESTIPGGTYWPKFWKPTFTCPFERCFGGCEKASKSGKDRGAWVCDPGNVYRLYQFQRAPCLVYSFGEDPTFKFEHDAEKMLRRCTIHAFYPKKLSHEALSHLPGYIHYHPFGLSGKEKEVNGIKYMSLASLMKRFHHQGRDLEILKIDDCEGCNIDGLDSALKGIFIRQFLLNPRRIAIGKVAGGSGEWAPGGFHLAQSSNLIQTLTTDLGYVVFHSSFALATTSAQVSLIRFGSSFFQNEREPAAPSGLLQAESVAYPRGQTMLQINRESHALQATALSHARTLESFWSSKQDELGGRANPLAPSGFGDSFRYNGKSSFSARHGERRLDIFEERLESLVRSAGLKMFRRIEFEVDSHGLGESAVSLLQHFGESAGWLQVPLMSSDGKMDNLLPCKPHCKPTDAWLLSTATPLYDLMSPLLPAIRQMRLSNVFPGEIITYHSDEVKGCRCHMPISRSKGAHTKIGMQKAPEFPGAAYCGDFSFPHMLYNKGNVVRTHLFFDLEYQSSENAMTLRETKFGQGVLDACEKIHNQPNRKKVLERAAALLEEYKSVYADVDSQAQAEKYAVEMSTFYSAD